tara:strand:- start:490 stop:711 length:222 start_codon:yes stop_codon:yes gene_type:complete
MTISNKELAQWFDTSSTLITILEEYNDKHPQINFASETARLHLAEYLIEKIKVRNKENNVEEHVEEHVDEEEK